MQYRKTAATTSSTHVPNTFHYVWLSGEPKPSIIEACIDTWRTHNPDFDVIEWTLDNTEWKKNEFCRQAVSVGKWAFATDVLRLQILYDHGGVYLDSDVVVHKPLSNLMGRGFIPWEDDELLGPHVVGAPKHSPIIKTWLDAYATRQFILDSSIINVEPMPNVLTEVSRDILGLNHMGLPQRLLGEFDVLPSHVGTSRIDDRNIFEHLYHGGWLPDKTNYQDGLREKCRRLEGSRSRALLAFAYYHCPWAEPCLSLPQRVRRQRRDLKAKRRDLWSLAHRLPQRSSWHLTSAKPAFPTPAPLFGKPLVSIIIPAYNVERYLGRCVASALRQTYGNIEVIAVDDGSTDGCQRIMLAAADTDSRLRVVSKPNGGLGSARNAGIDASRGDYLCFLDGDDWVSPTFIDSFVSSAGANTEIVVCDHAKVLPDGRQLSESRCGRDTQEHDSAKHLFLSDVECYAWNKMFRRECFARPEFRFGPGLFEDLYTVPALLGAAKDITFTRQIDYFYVQRPDSILASAQKSGRNQFEIFPAADALIEKAPLFRPDRWAFYYDHKLAYHLFLYRKEALLAGYKHEPTELKRFGIELARRMPNWRESKAVRHFLKSGNDHRQRRRRQAQLERFG